MQKFILLSVVFAMICVPILGGRAGSVARGLKKTLLILFAVNFLYLLVIVLVYSHLQ